MKFYICENCGFMKQINESEMLELKKQNKKLIRELKIIRGWLNVEISRNYMSYAFDRFIFSHLKICERFKKEIEELLKGELK